MRKMFCFYLLLATISILILACVSTAGPEETENTILFQDNFTDPKSGWDSSANELGATEYTENGFLISVNAPGRFFWANPYKHFSDVSITVTVKKISGGDDNSFGVICRHQNTDNFYALVISSDGYYGIRKRINGNPPIYIGYDMMQYTNIINTGETENILRADCIGTTLSLYVNGQLLMQVQDSTIMEGDVGLFAGTFEAESTQVLFSNFIVSRP
jgi:hypothetical protein